MEFTKPRLPFAYRAQEIIQFREYWLVKVNVTIGVNGENFP
jgi:hypothetical protein